MRPSASGLRILFVSDIFPPEIGGVAAVAEAIASNLPSHIVVAAPRSGQRAQPAFDWEAHDRRFSFPIHRVDAFSTHLNLPAGRVRGALQFAINALWTRPRAIASLHRLLARHPVDVVCINTIASYWIPVALKRRYPRLKTVFYLHGEEISSGPRQRRLDQLAHVRLRESDAVIVVSSFTRDLALGIGVDPNKLTVINNGVDTVRFTPGLPDAAIEKRFALKGKRILLCLARLDERKGQDTLIEAMPEILAALPETVLLLVGGGTYEPDLRNLRKTLKLEQNVLFAGVASDEEVVHYYRTAHVYAMPNRTTESGDTEGFGLVFLEAGACGKPVIGGRAGGVPDAILDGQTGLLVDGRSSRDVAQACVRLLSNPGLAQQFGAAGLEHSERNTWQAQSQKFLAICKQICGQDDCGPDDCGPD